MQQFCPLAPHKITHTSLLTADLFPAPQWPKMPVRHAPKKVWLSSDKSPAAPPPAPVTVAAAFRSLICSARPFPFIFIAPSLAAMCSHHGQPLCPLFLESHFLCARMRTLRGIYGTSAALLIGACAVFGFSFTFFCLSARYGLVCRQRVGLQKWLHLGRVLDRQELPGDAVFSAFWPLLRATAAAYYHCYFRIR